MPNFGSDRYELAGLISQSATSSLFRARDTQSGDLVSLRILHGFMPLDPQALLKEYELFKPRLTIEQEGLARHLDFGEWNGTYYFSEQFVKGITLKEAIQDPCWSDQHSFSLLRKLSKILEGCHQQEFFHKWIRPSNILLENGVSEDPKELKVTLIGGGQADVLTLARADHEVGDEDVYLAPEFIGYSEGTLDARCDIYSLGVLLYYLLTRVTPYPQEDRYALIHQMVTSLPQRACLKRPDISSQLDEFIWRCIEKKPRDRLGTIEVFLSSLNELGTEELSVDKSENSDLHQFSDDEIRVPLLERKSVLKRIYSQFDQAIQGKGGVVLIRGEAGAGKSRLGEELRNYTHANRGIFLWCPATMFESQKPYSVIRDAVLQLVQVSRGLSSSSRSSLKSRVSDAIGGFGRELAISIPEAQEFQIQQPEIVKLDPHRQQQRATKTILNLLQSLSGKDAPILFFVDDCEWLDPGSKELFEKLQKSLHDTHMLLVLTETQQKKKPSDPSRTKKFSDLLDQKHLQIELKPLSREGVLKLFESGLHREGNLVKDLAMVAYKRCGGNPRLLMEILKTIRIEMRDEAIENREGLVAFQSMIPKANAEALMRKRWEQLDDAFKEIISLACVIGSKFSSQSINQISQQEETLIEAALTEGCRQNLMTSWTVLEQRWYCFSGDGIHDEIYNSIETKKRQALHAQIAEALEADDSQGEENIYEIAFHYLRSHELEKAQTYSLKAAKEAKRAHANVQASRFYREALELHPEDDFELRHEILEDFGDVLSLTGQYEEALSSYEEVLSLIQEPLVKARLEGKIGGLYFRRGMNGQAIEHMTKGLDSLGFRSPKSRVGLVWSLTKSLGGIVSQALVPSFFRILGRGKSEYKRAAINILHSLAYALYFLDKNRTLEVHLRQLNLAESLGESEELAHTYSSHGVVCSIIPLHGRAMRFQQAGLKMRERLNDRWGIGQSYAFMGVCSYYRGALSQAVEYLQRSISTLKELGDQWEIEAAYSHLGFCYNLLGELEAAEKSNKTLLALSEEIQDKKFIALSQLGLAETEYLRGNYERALTFVSSSLNTQADHFSVAMAQRVKGQILLRLNRFQEAQQILEDSIQLIEDHSLQNEYLVANYLVMAHIYLYQPQRVRDLAHNERKVFLQKVRKLLNKGSSLARKFPNVLGYSHLVKAIYYQVLDKPRRVKKEFSLGLKILKKQGRDLDFAKLVVEEASYLVSNCESIDSDKLAATLTIFRRTGAKAELERARNLLGPEYSKEKALRSRVESQQISTLFSMSRAISSLLDLDQLMIQITDLAISTLECERGYLFFCRGEGKPQIRCARGMNRNDISIQLPSQSTQLIHSVWKSSIAKVCNLEVGDEHSWSVMVVPIQLNEKMLALLYLENRVGSDLYNDDDLEFLTVFSSQAAVAIQNALLYRHAEELNMSLEQKVRERTYELLKSKDELENANKLKSEFLANMSHELRTPLNAIIAMSEIMAEETFGPLNEKQQVYTKQVLDSGVHLLALINDVLDLSKVEAGQLELEIDPFLLSDLLKGSVMIVRENALKKDITLELDADESIGIIPGDARRIKQVIYNLLSNAIKFTPDGGTVSVEARRTENTVTVCVSDTGIGISEDDLKIIFEEFRQVDSSYSRQYEGTGLGLALTRKFIEMHKGNIWVESEVGKGSQFYFSLPTEQSEEGSPTSEEMLVTEEVT